MVTQAKETHREIWKKRGVDLENQPRGFWKIGHASFHKNPRIAITVKLMVKMKNLFRIQDSLGPCLEDANIKLHLPLCGKL